MIQCRRNDDQPGLLVSVRNALEASAALAGGADVIDVKEPARGPLGPADAAVFAQVLALVGGQAPVTAAAGELADILANTNSSGGLPSPQPFCCGASLVKFGLAGCDLRPGWQPQWRRWMAAQPDLPPSAIVAYADWRAAHAPHPADALEAAVDFGCTALLVDTWDKSAGTLFDHWPQDDLHAYVKQARRIGLVVALAGSLTCENLHQAVAAAPDLIAVRGAACEGGRSGPLTRERVTSLGALLRAAWRDRPAGTGAAGQPATGFALATTSNPRSRII